MENGNVICQCLPEWTGTYCNISTSITKEFNYQIDKMISTLYISSLFSDIGARIYLSELLLNSAEIFPINQTNRLALSSILNTTLTSLFRNNSTTEKAITAYDPVRIFEAAVNSANSLAEALSFESKQLLINNTNDTDPKNLASEGLSLLGIIRQIITATMVNNITNTIQTSNTKICISPIASTPSSKYLKISDVQFQEKQRILQSQKILSISDDWNIPAVEAVLPISNFKDYTDISESLTILTVNLFSSIPGSTTIRATHVADLEFYYSDGSDVSLSILKEPVQIWVPCNKLQPYDDETTLVCSNFDESTGTFVTSGGNLKLIDYVAQRCLCEWKTTGIFTVQSLPKYHVTKASSIRLYTWYLMILPILLF
jgi:hypothetical protein